MMPRDRFITDVLAIEAEEAKEAGAIGYMARALVQATQWESTLILGERFFEESTHGPVPVDLRALKALRRSPMALDVYCLLNYRMSYLKKCTVIPWRVLQIQFGAEYSRERDFKVAFLLALRKVLCIYHVNAEEHAKGLLIKPSRSHIPRCV
jgi:hypothetical protein